MGVRARVSSKGRVTIPRAVREALSIREGDEVLFRVEGRRATIARNPDLMELAGSVRVPVVKQGTPWNEGTAPDASDKSIGRRSQPSLMRTRLSRNLPGEPTRAALFTALDTSETLGSNFLDTLSDRAA